MLVSAYRAGAFWIPLRAAARRLRRQRWRDATAWALRRTRRLRRQRRSGWGWRWCNGAGESVRIVKTACGGDFAGRESAYFVYNPVFWNSRRFCFGIRAATVVISRVDHQRGVALAVEEDVGDPLSDASHMLIDPPGVQRLENFLAAVHPAHFFSLELRCAFRHDPSLISLRRRRASLFDWHAFVPRGTRPGSEEPSAARRCRWSCR